MKRSCSTQHKKNSRSELHKGMAKKQAGQKIKIQINESVKICDHDIKTQRPLTCRSAFEERLTKIREGFQNLQKNLDFTHMNSFSPSAIGQSQLTSRKLNRKLFNTQTNKKAQTMTTTKQAQQQKSSKQTMIKKLQSAGPSAKHSIKYHSCTYQKSIFNLMKIILMQKQEIIRLSCEVRANKKNK